MIMPVASSSVSAATAVPIPAYSAAQTPSTGGYRPSTPSSIGHGHTFNSVSTATNGTTRSSLLLAHMPQDSLRQHTRPASMHAASAGNGSGAQQQQPPLAMQAQQLLNGSANRNSRPASFMQRSISSNHSYRRASNSDMYASFQQHQQQQQQQPQQYMDPRAPSSIGGMYQQHGTNSPTPIIQQQPPHIGSPRSRASTYNGPAQQSLPPNMHTGNFSTLTANTQPPGIMILPRQPNSALSSPCQQSPSHQHPIQPQYQQQHRPMSSAGMHNMAPSLQMGVHPGSAMTGPYIAPAPPAAATPPNVYCSATP
ncbi:hypothetical protein H4R27_000560, partial [Coemansia aciculifera]